jgi:uncharacterized membrane protein YedE/YeeE
MPETKKYPFHEQFLKKEWSYPMGAVLLAFLAMLLVLVTDQAWGVTGPLAIWGGKFLELIGINADSWEIYHGTLAKYNFWKNSTSLTNLGIVLGALLSTLLAAQFKIKKIKSGKNIAAAVIGGLLMGVGARFALGCNIGSFFSALPAFSLHGWVFGIFIFLGAAVGSKLLTKYFM